jgi:large subunit ribosomal protein L25
MVQNETLALQAQSRSVIGKKVAQLRADGITPGVVYGHGKETVSIQLEQVALDKIYAQAGRGSLINLTIDNQPAIPVVIQELSRNRLTDAAEHVDFHAVRMDQTITAQVSLIFAGESAAVKAMGGTFVKNKDHITVKCLPSQLIKELTIDISTLATFEDSIKINSLKLPDGVQVMDQPDDIIALVKPPRTDEELAALNSSVTEDVSKVEGVVKETPAAATDEKAKKDAKKE